MISATMEGLRFLYGSTLPCGLLQFDKIPAFRTNPHYNRLQDAKMRYLLLVAVLFGLHIQALGIHINGPRQGSTTIPSTTPIQTGIPCNCELNF